MKNYKTLTRRYTTVDGVEKVYIYKTDVEKSLMEATGDIRWNKLDDLGVYVSSAGTVATLNGRPYKGTVAYNGEKVIYHGKTLIVSRLVAYAFGLIDSYDSKKIIRHKDKNKLNNEIKNLKVVRFKKKAKRNMPTTYKIKKYSVDELFDKLDEYDADNGTEYRLEEWRYIKDRKGDLIFVSDKGHIMSNKGHILTPAKNNHGYYGILVNGKYYLVHRLVACAFGILPSMKYDNYMDVDHINNDRADNRVENLQVLSHRDNIAKRDASNNTFKVALDVYDYDGRYIKTFSSGVEAARALNLQSSNICKCAKNFKLSTGGYKFKRASC